MSTLLCFLLGGGVCLLLGRWWGFAVAAAWYRRGGPGAEAFPVGWSVGQVGISPNGAVTEWCGDDAVVQWLNELTSNHPNHCRCDKTGK